MHIAHARSKLKLVFISQRFIKVWYPQNFTGLIQKNKRGFLYNVLNHYWKIDETEVMISTILDPRTKKKQFGNEDNLYEKNKRRVNIPI